MFLCRFCAEWRIQRLVHHRGPWQCQTETWCDPQVSCQSQPGPPSTRSTCPSHQGDGGRGRGCSDGGVIMNSCSGRSSGGGCQANTSTWSPLARRATQRKALLRGLRCRLPAGAPCHRHNSVAWDMRWWCLDLSSSFFPSTSQESPLSTWTVSSHSLRTQSLYSSQPNFSHVSKRVLNELYFVCTNS